MTGASTRTLEALAPWYVCLDIMRRRASELLHVLVTEEVDEGKTVTGFFGINQ